MATAASHTERFEIPDDIWEAQTFFEEKGWSDGLPMIPPTEERVSQMLAATTRSWLIVTTVRPVVSHSQTVPVSSAQSYQVPPETS